MLIAIEQTIQVLEIIVQAVPVGTNIALLQLMWSIINGSFLGSRGAIYPALQANGLNEQEINRSWAAMRYGKWTISEFIQRWRGYVAADEQWESHEYEGQRPVAVDWTAIWRPKLKGWKGKFFNGLLGRATTGVGLGLVADVGQIGEQRIPILRKIMRPNEQDGSESGLKKETLKWVAHHLSNDEVAVVDAGVEVSDLQTAGIEKYVVRLALNCTGRRNYLPAYKGRGRRPTWGEKVRPLPRKYADNTILATPPDMTTAFIFEGREIVVHGWQDLVLPTCQPDETNLTYHIWVFFDPLYQHPLVLGTNLTTVKPETIFRLYLDRWPVEQIPLVAKQMLGLHRQFVFASQSCYRLPELAFLMGNVLTYLAAVLPPIPTGFWDQRPKKHPAVCVVSWLKLIFLIFPCLTLNFAKRTLFLIIYPRVWPLIVAKKPHFSSSHQFLSVF